MLYFPKVSNKQGLDHPGSIRLIVNGLRGKLPGHLLSFVLLSRGQDNKISNVVKFITSPSFHEMNYKVIGPDTLLVGRCSLQCSTRLP